MLPDYAPLLKTFLFLFCEICVALSILQPAKYREIWKNQYENQQLLYYVVKFKDIRDLMNLQFLLPRCVSMPDIWHVLFRRFANTQYRCKWAGTWNVLAASSYISYITIETEKSNLYNDISYHIIISISIACDSLQHDKTNLSLFFSFSKSVIDDDTLKKLNVVEFRTRKHVTFW